MEPDQVICRYKVGEMVVKEFPISREILGHFAIFCPANMGYVQPQEDGSYIVGNKKGKLTAEYEGPKGVRRRNIASKVGLDQGFPEAKFYVQPGGCLRLSQPGGKCFEVEII